MKIEIFDTTLRDGSQGAGVEFSRDDTVRVVHALDALGVSYIEAGMITDSESAERLDELADRVGEITSKLTVFTRTCRVGERAEKSPFLALAGGTKAPAASIFGKSWLAHVTDVLGTTGEENLRMIRESVSYLKKCGKEVIFDAEHFFDGYSDNPDYAMAVLEAAHEGGADRLVLCDTNGGNLPDVIGMVTAGVGAKYENIGVHCHNDMGMAVSCTVSAVLSGAMQVQGTVSGIGERCGNANLDTLIPVLQLKLGFDCIGDRIKNLTKTARVVREAANLSFNESEPFVGGYAFTHKAGTHIDGVIKAPRSFEHISPETVGNVRNIVVSSLGGRAALTDKMKEYLTHGGEISKDDPRVGRAAELIHEREKDGFDYENADASLALAIDDSLGIRRHFFNLLGLKVIVNDQAGGDVGFSASAIIKISVDGREYLTAGEGNGPVNAIDEALRRALIRFYPEIADMRLTDYRVRVLDSKATASSVRVSIESSDGKSVWRTVGVSSDVIHASWQALCDSVEFMLCKTRK